MSLVFVLGTLITAPVYAQSARPNILWLSCEDISPHIGCYGDPHAMTPHIDRLASEGVRYSHAFTTAGVCAPCRSGIITGMYQTSIGTHHMRCQAELPANIKPFPIALRAAGYYCTNNSKQDYQFSTPRGTWDESSRKAHWKNRPDDAPFFAVFNFTGCHESGIASAGKYQSVTQDLTDEQRQDPAQLSLPPYYADTPAIREDWKRNYELITAMDAWVGDHLRQLRAANLAEDTIVFFWSDHGVGLPRAKRWLYDSGTHIPLVLRVPSKYRTAGQAAPGSVSSQLVSSIDFGPTVLRLAGVPIPDHIQGQPFLGSNLPPQRPYVYGARDRMDERYDIIRMVRDQRFKYIRNYEPLKTYYQYMNTPEQGATMSDLRRLFDAGQLNPHAAAYFAPTKPVEELYDCQADPHEIHNLADNPQFQRVLQRMRTAHLQWVQDTRDLGLIPEAIIAAREKDLGSRYEILRQPAGTAYNARLGQIAKLASDGLDALPQLIQALQSDDDAIRYWGATGIGNIGQPARDAAIKPLQTTLRDHSPAVQIASARALCRLGSPQEALEVLIKNLTAGEQWERLQAAIVLDEIDDQARPVLESMRAGLQYEPTFYSDGKYRVRVINRALNELEGTRNSVK